MNTLKISGVVRGQYEQLCAISYHKCKGDKKLLDYKIRRAVDLGKVSHRYNNGCQIIRYNYLNFLVGHGEIMTMWKDRTRDLVEVDESIKDLHKDLFYDKKLKLSDVVKLLTNLS